MIHNKTDAWKTDVNLLISINLLEFYHDCPLLIGYTTYYVYSVVYLNYCCSKAMKRQPCWYVYVQLFSYVNIFLFQLTTASLKWRLGAWRKWPTGTQHEGKTERAKESHDRCSQPLGMRMLKTADLGTQAFLVVNSFKLHLTALYLHGSWKREWTSSIETRF